MPKATEITPLLNNAWHSAVKPSVGDRVPSALSVNPVTNSTDLRLEALPQEVLSTITGNLDFGSRNNLRAASTLLRRTIEIRRQYAYQTLIKLGIQAKRAGQVAFNSNNIFSALSIEELEKLTVRLKKLKIVANYSCENLSLKTLAYLSGNLAAIQYTRKFNPKPSLKQIEMLLLSLDVQENPTTNDFASRKNMALEFIRQWLAQLTDLQTLTEDDLRTNMRIAGELEQLKELFYFLNLSSCDFGQALLSEVTNAIGNRLPVHLDHGSYRIYSNGVSKIKELVFDESVVTPLGLCVIFIISCVIMFLIHSLPTIVMGSALIFLPLCGLVYVVKTALSYKTNVAKYPDITRSPVDTAQQRAFVFINNEYPAFYTFRVPYKNLDLLNAAAASGCSEKLSNLLKVYFPLVEYEPDLLLFAALSGQVESMQKLHAKFFFASLFDGRPIKDAAGRNMADYAKASGNPAALELTKKWGIKPTGKRFFPSVAIGHPVVGVSNYSASAAQTHARVRMAAATDTSTPVPETSFISRSN